MAEQDVLYLLSGQDVPRRIRWNAYTNSDFFKQYHANIVEKWNKQNPNQMVQSISQLKDDAFDLMEPDWMDLKALEKHIQIEKSMQDVQASVMCAIRDGLSQKEIMLTLVNTLIAFQKGQKLDPHKAFDKPSYDDVLQLHLEESHIQVLKDYQTLIRNVSYWENKIRLPDQVTRISGYTHDIINANMLPPGLKIWISSYQHTLQPDTLPIHLQHPIES